MDKKLTIFENLKNIEPHLKKISEQHNKILNLSIGLNEELKTKNQEFQDIIESLPTGLIAVDNQKIIVHFNRAVAEFTKITPYQARGQNINKLLMAEIIPDNFLEIEQKYIPKHFYYVTPQKERKKLAYKLKLLPTKAGIIIHIEDITLVEKLIQESERQDRLTAMGKMAASIAHEIRNPLASIKLFSSTLAKELEKDKEKTEILNYILQSVKTANFVISNLIQYTKQLHLSKKKINLQTLLQNFYQMNRPLIEQQGCELTLQNKVTSPFVEADVELLTQVLNNILNNAIQATHQSSQKKPLIEIRIENQVSKQSQQKTVCIAIQDWGCGMPEFVKNQIFTPFYSNKNSGIGLGMSITKNIIDRHSGEIIIESQEEKGTTVFLHFLQI